MAVYNYTAVDTLGRDKKGSVEAENQEKARDLLKADKLIVLSVEQQSIMTREVSFQIGGKPKVRDLSIFCRQFVSIIESGITVIDAFGNACCADGKQSFEKSDRGSQDSR